MLSGFLQTFRYTLRGLRNNPGFASIAILSLALGIGANTAIFTLMNAMLLRDLPVRNPDQLVQLRAVRPDAQVPFSYPMLRELERHQRVFTGLVVWGGGGMFSVEANGVFSREHLTSVTGNGFSELGATPEAGRLLVPADSDPSSASSSEVAVLGYAFWKRRFAGSPDVVGKEIRIEGHPFTVVGVAGKSFVGMTNGEPPDITIPITAFPELDEGNSFELQNRSILWLFVIGRLKPGVSIDQARSQLMSVWPEVLRASASTETAGPRRERFLSMGLAITSASKGFATGLRFQFVRPLRILAVIVALILLVACVNLANLMLARSAARSHEMGVRVVIGASRWSLARQVLAEGLVLSCSGALLGLVFASWGSHLLLALMTSNNAVPVAFDLATDPWVLTATIAVAILTGILFALAPAWRSAREDPATLLRRTARGFSGASRNLGKLLMLAQVALSVVLLLGAAVLAGSFEKLRTLDLGFQEQHILQIELYPRPGGYQNLDIAAYHRELLEHVAELPGITSVAFSDYEVPSVDGWQDLAAVASADPVTAVRVMTNAVEVSPGFFETLDIPMLRGRAFSEAEGEKQPRVAVVSAALAKRLFPGGDALGKSVSFGVMPGYQNIEIVGVVPNARIFHLREANSPILYLSSLQFPRPWGNLLVRAGEAPEAVEKSVSQEIDSLGREYVLRTKPLADVVGGQLTEDRTIALLSGFFAALALLLCAIGLYGLVSYAVTRRTREIGVRVAVGAQRRTVLWLVLRETLQLALLGLAIGIPIALAASRLITSMLFGITPADPRVIAAVTLTMLAVAALAGYFPARRASSLDPISALRVE